MNKEVEMLKEHFLKQKTWLTEHPKEDINIGKFVELLIETAKNDSIDIELTQLVKELLKDSLDRLITMDLKLNEDNSLCSFLKELSISAVERIPAVDEKNEEYFKKLATISLFTRQQDRKRRQTNETISLFKTEKELKEIRELREQYKQNYQVTKIEKITDALFLEIVTADLNDQILNFELPVDTKSLDSEEMDLSKESSILSEIDIEESIENDELDKIWDDLEKYLTFTEEEKEFIRVNRIKN